MSVPNKFIVLEKVNEQYRCKLRNIKRKQILYEGLSEGKKVVLCTPSSKLHSRGHGWFDLNSIQVALLDDADIAILAIRLQGNKVYYVDFKELRNLMVPEIMYENPSEGKHWKFYIWPEYLELLGGADRIAVRPEIIS